MIISIWRYSHLLLALTASIFIIIASITGVILAFEPINEKIEDYKIKGVEEISLGEVVELFQNKYEEIIEIKTDHNQFVFAQLITTGGEFLSGYFNPNTGEYLGPEIEQSKVFKFATNLHRSLFLKSTGRLLVAIATFFLFLISISGIILIIRRQGSVKRFFYKIVNEKFIQYFHVVLGRLSFLPIIIITLTGVYLSLLKFDVVAEGISQSYSKNKTSAIAEQINSKDFLIFQNTKLIDVKSLVFPFSNSVDDYYKLLLADREIEVNQKSGEIMSEKHYTISNSLKELSISLHTGRGSIIWSIILGICCINILYFTYSGFLMTYHRKRTKLKNHYNYNECKHVILVGSENGDTFSFASSFYKKLIEQGEKAYITELNNYRYYKNCKNLILMSSTYGKGISPKNGDRFLKLVKSVKQNEDINYSVLGFGSKAYPDFCKFAIEITKVMKSTYNTPLIQPFYIDNKSEKKFNEWLALWCNKTDINIPESNHI